MASLCLGWAEGKRGGCAEGGLRVVREAGRGRGRGKGEREGG